MRIWLTAFLAGIFLLRPAVSLAQSAEAIDAAIENGKKYLYSQLQSNGTWETTPSSTGPEKAGDVTGSQWGGRTALATYALLTCGEKPSDPKLKPAIEFLQKQQQINGTYVTAIKCLVWLNLPETPEVKAAMRRDAAALRATMKPQKQGLPVWDYGPSARSAYSLSRSQYGALGLWAATEMNVEVPVEVWRSIERTWETAQAPDGGWRYKIPADMENDVKTNITTLSMTASGLATMYVTQDFTRADTYSNPRGNAKSPHIEKGLAWVIANFDKHIAGSATPQPREYTYPQLYSIERTGLASGLRRFGPHDWYARGATFLLKAQQKNGSWGGGEKDVSLGNSVVNASFAMLFLHRGSTPVAFNKLDYTDGVTTDADKAFWNQRPRDVANLTRWLSKSLERELRWQIVRTDSDLPALLESPLLYVSGGNAVAFKPEVKALLKSYVESGGMIVAHADGNNEGFNKSMMDLGKELFPANEWRELPDDHPIYTNQTYRREAMKTKPQMRGLSNGVREMIVLLHNGDPAKAWQLRNANSRPESWQLAANLISYVTDKSTFYPRGTSWLAEASSTAKVTRTLTVGRLKYSGNWDPEPQAWAQLSKYARARKGLEVKTEVVEAGKAVPKVNLLVISGTSAFQLDEAARKEIKTYADAGGTVLFEAVGGSAAFGSSAEVELAKMYGAESLKHLPSKHPIYGTDLKISFRPFNIMTVENPIAPQIRGVEDSGRVKALLSQHDITAGLLGIPTDGITGYMPESARALMTQLLGSLK